MPDEGSGHSRAIAGPCVLHGHRRKRLGGERGHKGHWTKCLGRGHLRPATSAYAWGTQLWFEYFGGFCIPTLRHMSRTLMGL